jgi:hypothetical protein
MLSQIENELAEGVYRPGGWAGFLRVARWPPRAERLAMSPDVTRVSDKLHKRRHAFRLPFWVGLAEEAAGTVVGGALLEAGLDRRSTAFVIASAVILTITLQPLVKIAVGCLIGIRYSHFFFFGAEPRFKMRYGTYLGAERWGRVLLHLSGGIGIPLPIRLAPPDSLTQSPRVCSDPPHAAASVASAYRVSAYHWLSEPDRQRNFKPRFQHRRY